jgi:hypothetical protein
MRIRPVATFIVVLAVTAATASIGQSSRIDAAFQKFWTATSPAEAAKATTDITRSGVTFDDALQRLKRGRQYLAEKSGVLMLSNKENGSQHFFAVNVPENYDPSRRYQLRFQLHGGVDGRRTNEPRGSGEIGALAGAEQFYVLPYSWNASPWWSKDQVLNLAAIVDALKRTYNIDENRVVVAGVSDGATGAYYIGMHETTPFASFLPLNGFIMVLGNNGIDNGDLFPNNLRNKPWFVVNGGLDRLYPTSAVEPFTNHLKNSGIEIDYHPEPDGQHNTAWWPWMKAPFEKFVADHPRNPDPDTLTWETADLSLSRAHWLVIDKLGAQPNDAREMPDANTINSFAMARFAANTNSLFDRSRPSGRVDLLRKGNTVEATTRGVSSFTLLLSPDKFDFTKPAKVVANGRTVFEGRIEKSLETLLKWAARDNDRTMLYAAEVKITLNR